MPVMTDHGATETGPAHDPAEEPEDTAADARTEAGDEEPADADETLAGTDESESESVAAESESAETASGAIAAPAGLGARVQRRLPAGRTLITVVPLVVLLAATAFLGWKVWDQHQLNQAGEEAQRTAVNYAQVLTSIDSNNVDENFQQVLDGATGEFKDLYSQSSMELRQLLIENKATARGVVVDSAVQSISKDRAVVLLFVDQSVTNTKLPDPRIDRSRMKMTLEKADGAWRASKVELP